MDFAYIHCSSKHGFPIRLFGFLTPLFTPCFGPQNFSPCTWCFLDSTLIKVPLQLEFASLLWSSKHDYPIRFFRFSTHLFTPCFTPPNFSIGIRCFSTLHCSKCRSTWISQVCIAAQSVAFELDFLEFSHLCSPLLSHLRISRQAFSIFFLFYSIQTGLRRSALQLKAWLSNTMLWIFHTSEFVAWN